MEYLTAHISHGLADRLAVAFIAAAVLLVLVAAWAACRMAALDADTDRLLDLADTTPDRPAGVEGSTFTLPAARRPHTTETLS